MPPVSAKDAGFCRILFELKSVFTPCKNASVSDVSFFQTTCVFDVNATEGDRAKRETACHHIKSFAKFCADHGFIVNWRDAAGCRESGAHLINKKLL